VRQEVIADKETHEYPVIQHSLQHRHGIITPSTTQTWYDNSLYNTDMV